MKASEILYVLYPQKGNFSSKYCSQGHHEHIPVQRTAWQSAMQSLCQVKRGHLTPSRRENQPGVQLSTIHPAFHPGNIWALSSVSFYAADVKTWLPINSLQLSSLTDIPSRYSTLSCNLLLPSHHKIPKLVGFGDFFF